LSCISEDKERASQPALLSTDLVTVLPSAAVTTTAARAAITAASAAWTTSASAATAATMPAAASTATTRGTVAAWTVWARTGCCVYGFTIRVFTVEVRFGVVIEVTAAFKGDWFFAFSVCVAFRMAVIATAVAASTITAFGTAIATSRRHLGPLFS